MEAIATDFLGYVAAFLFAFCGLPQAVQCYKQGHAMGVSAMLLWMWAGGEILMQAYVLIKHGFDLPLLANYWLNSIFVLIIMRYKLWPRELPEPNRADITPQELLT